MAGPTRIEQVRALIVESYARGGIVRTSDIARALGISDSIASVLRMRIEGASPIEAPPTDRQIAMLAFIEEYLACEYLACEKWPPTTRELGEAFSIRSSNGIACYLRALERRGLIERVPRLSRAIRVTALGLEWIEAARRASR